MKALKALGLQSDSKQMLTTNPRELTKPRHGAIHSTEGFLTPDSFHLASLATWGSSWASKEAKFMKKFDFLGFSRCFSVRFEQT